MRKGFDLQGGVRCRGCFQKDLEILSLKEEVQKLKAEMKRRHQKVMEEGVFGLSTPSSKLPVKRNATPEDLQKRGGAKKGHPGQGRKRIEEAQADRVVEEVL